MLRDPAPDAPPPPPPVAGKPAPVVVAPPPPPDLVRLLGDSQARIRRRAALAIGRVGLPEGVPPLVKLLADRRSRSAADGGVRPRPHRRSVGAASRWSRVLRDPSPLVKGSAAEALGLIGDRSAADAVGADGVGRSFSPVRWRSRPAQTPMACGIRRRRAFRLALFALVRLNAYNQLAAAVLDGAQPRVRWWPVAFALQRLEDPRAVPALLTLVQDPQPIHAGVRRERARRDEGSRGGPASGAARRRTDRPVAVEAIRALGRLGDPAAAAPLLKLIAATEVRSAAAARSRDGASAESEATASIDRCSTSSAIPAHRSARRRFARSRSWTRRTSSRCCPGSIRIRTGPCRSALASVLGTLPPEVGLPRLRGDARRHRRTGDSSRGHRGGGASAAGCRRIHCSSV